jgi:hypothetical protein
VGLSADKLIVNPAAVAAAIKALVLDSDMIVTEHGLMGKGDNVLAGIGGDELLEERTVDLRTISGKSPAWA